MAALGPEIISYNSVEYPFKKFLGKGGSGTVGLYGNEKTGYLVLKKSYCNEPDGFSKSEKENQTAIVVAGLPPCEPADVFWRRGTNTTFPSHDLVRAPLSRIFQGGCSYALYEYVPENLAEWLQHHQHRKSDHVVGIFLQIVTILRCLRKRGYYYNDLKPSNVLLWQEPNGFPRVKIGDLGGLDRQGEPRITVTPSRFPPKMLKNMSWKNIDLLTSFLLGELILQLLFRSPGSGEDHPMNDFLKCIKIGDTNACTSRLLDSLRERLAEGLSLENPDIRDMAALAFNFLGYQGMYFSLEEALLLNTPLFRSTGR